MPRRRRRIESLKVYELCFRAKDSLPLVAYKIIDLIIEHAVARAQRDEKLYLCHDIWNGSHPHLFVFTKDAEQCKKFYMEVQKKITDCLKRLLGLNCLSIWEGRPTVAIILDLDQAINRISYFYANPAQDNLEACIERFPGLSSFKEFLSVKDGSIIATTEKEVLRLRLPTFPTITSQPSFQAESAAIRELKDKNKELQMLIRHPNIWMKAFRVRDRDVAEINQRIIKKLRRREKLAAWLRKLSGKPLLGRSNLKKQPILKPHTPKKRERKIFFLTSCKELALQLLDDFEDFCLKCNECYQEWLKGNFLANWPPGAFKPPVPPNMNILVFG